MVQYVWVGGERNDHSSRFHPDDRGEGAGVKSTPEIGVDEVDAGILDLTSTTNR